MDNPIESKESLSLELCRDLITDLQSENSDLKNKLAVVNELLRRFKLNEVTELNKQIVKITQKDLLTQLKIMKENSEAQSRASFLQQEEIHQLKTQLSYFESQSPKKSDPCKQSSKENLYSELESCRFSLKTLENELKFYKLQLSNHDSLKSENFQIKSELEELKQKFDLKEDNFKTFSLKQSSLQKKLDLLIKEKKLLEEKISELESDKRKLLEKWQSTLTKLKTEDQSKSRLKELEEMLDNEKKKNSSISLKMKDLSRKYEEIKENLEREKNYSSEVISSFKALHVQFKVLQDEKLLLDKINQDLSVKIHFSQSEHPTPEKTKNDLNLSSLHQDLAKTQQLLKKKNQEIIELKLSKATPRREFSDKDAENTEKELVYFKKYENLLEKFQKLQSEKTQIQNLYVMASSSISEKNQRIQDLTNKLFEFEDRLLTHSKTGESLKHLSINLTAASRGTY